MNVTKWPRTISVPSTAISSPRGVMLPPLYTKGQSLWVTGGYNDSDGHLKSTEIIQRDGTIVAGPDLPVALQCHTITAIREDEKYMLIGGYSGQYHKSTYYHYKTSNDSNDPWLEGPDLKEARAGHTAGLIFDKVNHTQYTVVVGGYNGSYLRSVEILKEGSNEWTQGKSSNSFCHCVCLF